MKYNPLYLLLVTAVIFISGCSKDINLNPTDQQEVPSQDVTETAPKVLSDVIRLKFDPQMIGKIEQEIEKTSTGLRSTEGDLDEFFSSINAKNMKRVFPYAGTYEARQRKAGLHLWYDINIGASANPDLSRAKAMKIAKSAPFIAEVEEVRLLKEPIKTYTLANEKTGLRSNNSGFNDPDLSLQWHYNNDGSLMRAKAHADINLFEAWKIETGKPNVIVAVVDGGIDYRHPDLKDNIHINMAEKNGVKGVDDDNNGFVDDIYGYNFALNKSQIVPHEHGTHVAGTVAARNNNGIGVAGVAGGDGTPNSGVRLLSCQIFSHSDEDDRDVSAGAPAAIVYGANNGAVICQNSWGYSASSNTREIPKADKEAIDYFIKYAGCDNNGNQLPGSPMKGGVVIFAAGNDGIDAPSFPAAYPKVISVSSMSYDFKAAPYTNRGDWVTIMAPGGNALQSKGQIYSTLPHNRYGYMQGTSMACPHVSGIAALVVSKFGGPGFTNEDLKKHLKTALRPYDINGINPKYTNRLGLGYIDAAQALATDKDNHIPENVKVINAKSLLTGIELNWEPVSDGDGSLAFKYNVYYSTDPITLDNYKLAQKIEVKGTMTSGSMQSFLHRGLNSDTQYYYAVEAVDRWGATSKGVALANAKTLVNNAPILELTDKTTVRLTGDETAIRIVKVTEPDHQEWTYTLEDNTYDVGVKRVGDEIHFTFRVSQKAGKYDLHLVVKDETGLESKLDIPFEIYYNHKPVFMFGSGKIYVGMKQPLKIRLNDLFSDTDKDELKYNIKNLDPDIATAKIEGEFLTVYPHKEGPAGISLTATDPTNLSAKGGLSIHVVKNSFVNLIYPTLVTDKLNIQLGYNVSTVQIGVYTQTGNSVISPKSYKTNDNNRIISLDLTSLQPGTYVLMVENSDERFTQSFIKR